MLPFVLVIFFTHTREQKPKFKTVYCRNNVIQCCLSGLQDPFLCQHAQKHVLVKYIPMELESIFAQFI